MKDLFLIRHAESNHPVGVNDFDRPLSENGYNEAEKTSLKLAQYQPLPQFFISSPARRALSTAMIFADALHISRQQVQPENMIYEATVPSLLSIINHFPEEYDKIAIFGHNPGITELAEYLSDEFIGSMPTAGIIHLQFSTNWQMVGAGTGEIKWRNK